MLQNQTHTTSLFRTSLRSWQASYKAQQEAQPTPAAEAAATPVQSGKPRVKRLVARRRKRAMAAQS